jgi:hypothetical protein
MLLPAALSSSLIYVSLPVGNNIIRRPPTVDAVPGSGPVTNIPAAGKCSTIPGYYTRPVPIDVIIRMDIRMPVDVHISAVETMRPVTSAITPGDGMIEGWSPPAAIPATPTKSKSHIKPVITITQAKVPAIPWIVTHVKSPRPWPWIIIIADPGGVIETSAIHNGGSVHKTIQVSRGISCIDIVGGHIIDIHEFRVIDR